MSKINKFIILLSVFLLLLVVIPSTFAIDDDVAIQANNTDTIEVESSIQDENVLQAGSDIYFDIQVTNEDPASSVGAQTVILVDCNINEGILAKFDATKDYLDEEMTFTFEDFKIPEKFSEIEQ